MKYDKGFNPNLHNLFNLYIDKEFKDKDINDIEILFKLYIKESKEEKKIILNKSNMKSLPDGDKLGKIIVCIIFKYAIQLMKKRK